MSTTTAHFHSSVKGRATFSANIVHIHRFLMKLFFVVALSGMFGLAHSYTYSDKWDNINIDDILGSQRLLRGYVDCLMDKGRCTADGKALKETLPDALANDCSKCTAKQKSGANKIIRFLVNKRPDLWKELASKYDPNNVYQQKYKDKLDAIKS